MIKIEKYLWLGAGLLTFVAGSARPAAACGGIVSEGGAVVVQAQQRVLISLLSDGTSHIVVQLGVPEASVPFGALTPVSGLPTLDPRPINVSDMAELDEATRPRIWTRGAEPEAAGCGCGSGSDVKAGGSNGAEGVGVVQVVDIGPVTAAVLSAETAAELSAWLNDNGFLFPAAQQATLDAYLGAGKYFIAFKRNQSAGAGESGVGISFSVAGDQRGFPLRMSRIGAAQELGIQVFVAAPKKIAPRGSAPIGDFATLTLNDLEGPNLASHYAEAIRTKVAEHDGKAFVVEGVYYDEDWRADLRASLAAITEPGQVLSRLVTVVDPAELTQDVSFTGDAPKEVPQEVIALGAAPHGDGQLALFGGAMLGLSVRRGLRSRATLRKTRHKCQ